MLDAKTYTRDELNEYFSTKRFDSIKAKLKRQGYEFEVKGRAETATLTITKQPATKFRLFCIEELGFAPQTDFKRLKKFLFLFMFDDEFRQLPFVGMRDYMIKNFSVSNQTLCKWVTKLYQNGMIQFCDKIYFSVNKNKEIVYKQISDKEYKSAWKMYWDNKEELGTELAFMDMCQSIEGYPFRKELIIFNGIEPKNDKLEKILIEEIDIEE